MKPRYIVVCLEDGFYVAATHESFSSRELADIYAKGVAQSRQPIVVELLKPIRGETRWL